MESNTILDNLPAHLKKIIIDQPYTEYTSENHAVWRYVMRQNIKYLSKVAHHSYLDGLKKTGIEANHIPHMYGMNRILKEIGWAAASVDGFIPPAAFMEFQAHNVLVIAADIRPITQIGYTPAPDIIHEAAGHAPIIADEEYAFYLKLFGEIGSKAFSSQKDRELYKAIRLLSILKANPYASHQNIKETEAKLNLIKCQPSEPSELSQIRNLHWWTVEYGLIGDVKNPKIYGAGLLSSISESYNCLTSKVKKLSYNLKAATTSFDITTQQPQLFVTPNFKHLSSVLIEFSQNMALNIGGLYAINKAIASENTATCILDSGLQITGTFSDVIKKNGEAIYSRTSSPTALAYKNKQLENQDKSIHRDGFGFPIGNTLEFSKPLFELTKTDIESIKDADGTIILNFKSGIKVKGTIIHYTQKGNRLLLITLKNCWVSYNDTVLFEPAWGIYDMALGNKIASVYPGAADPDAFEFSYPQAITKTHKINYTEESKKLHNLYSEARSLGELEKDNAGLINLWAKTQIDYDKEWLLMIELLEISIKFNNEAVSSQIREKLNELQKNKNYQKLIIDGIKLIEN